MGSQVATNALNGKPLGDGVLMAGAIGLASSVGMGAAAKVGGKVLGKVLGRAAEAAESEVAGAAEEAESSLASDVEHAAESGCSFSSDTPVATPTGERAIGTLQVGDHVTAYDPATGKTSTQTVQHVWINHDNDLIDLTLRVTDQQQAAAVQNKQQEVALRAHGLRAPPADSTATTHDEVIHTTSRHPWLTTDQGFVAAGELHLGEGIVREGAPAATIVGLRVVPGAGTMYNLTVSVLHTYAVGASHFVVHNTGKACSLPTALTALEKGATEVTVATRSDAEAIFLKKFAGKGYDNTTGLFDNWKAQVGKFSEVKGPSQLAKMWTNMRGTYHWDTVFDGSGRLLNHAADDPDAYTPHLQIHPPGGNVIRIFFN